MKAQNHNRPAAIHRILLTFDDGPVPVVTSRMLDELARLQVPAVFFVVGRELAVPGMKEIVQRAAGEGHTIGNHGYSHADLTLLNEAQVCSEIRRTEDLIGHLDRGIKLFRPPFGKHNQRVDDVAAELGYTLMLWSVDCQDWNLEYQPDGWVDRTVRKIEQRQMGGRRHSVCVLHDVCNTTVEHLGRLVASVGELPHTAMAQYDPLHPQALRIAGEPPHTNPFEICPPDAVTLRVDDSLVVARPGGNSVIVLNETASWLWENLAGGASAEEAAQQLARAYAIPEAAAARDVQAAIAAWRRQGICGAARPECEDPGPWPLNYGEAPASVPNRFQQVRTYRFLDLDFRIRFDSLDLAAAIHPRFANLETVEDQAGGVSHFEVFASGTDFVLLADETVLARHPVPAALAYRLFFEIVRLAHPELDPMAWLHASSVGNRTATLALVGNNGSGKSTLCAALAHHGFQPFSDDRVFLDGGTQRLAATPNGITLKRGSWPVLLSRYPEIDSLPIVPGDDQELRFLSPPPVTERFVGPVTHLFFPRFQAAAQPAVSALTAVQALGRIATSEGWISPQPRHLERFLGWVQGVRCFDLAYPDVDSALALIQGCL